LQLKADIAAVLMLVIGFTLGAMDLKHITGDPGPRVSWRASHHRHRTGLDHPTIPENGSWDLAPRIAPAPIAICFQIQKEISPFFQKKSPGRRVDGAAPSSAAKCGSPSTNGPDRAIRERQLSE
jgi:hypothetical protein